MRILAASALVRAPGIPCFWLRSLFTFLRSPLKTTNLQRLLEGHGTTAIPRQIYLPTRESETDPPKREKARVTPPYHLKAAGRKFWFPTALFTKLGTRGAFFEFEVSLVIRKCIFIYIVMSFSCALFETETQAGLEPCPITFIKSLALFLSATVLFLPWESLYCVISIDRKSVV